MTPLDLLACPVCRGALSSTPSGAECGRGHAYDRARQGYLSLLQPGAHTGTGDEPGQVAARQRFLAAGWYAPLRDRLAELAAGLELPAGGVVDLGAGTGWYAAAVLDALPGRPGLALDTSKPALRLAARAHERLLAVAADVWAPLPVGDGAAALALVVFAPRAPAETARVLAPAGVLLTVTPGPGHLRELREEAALIGIEAGKEERLEEQLGAHLEPLDREELALPLELDPAAAGDLHAMTPSARHTTWEPRAVRATAEFVLRGWRRR
ncbi:23S rRNA m(1)G-748 methyltransferase [Motilibacter rhizosphaerae]|uniref:23S rRNA m(1)G-748 methyltransferase n=1 Tax=Motilibacter rhizosphaerae TaxID=598652 RepID=A0A4Q7NG30_9ACTN|nr:23S rRNA methyltransferase [Motilibacter rhizosphaerae]RZS82734.1 23S rRNA m(1)G-748 methyltransferase [Motilibacter rhizosphaerae]